MSQLRPSTAIQWPTHKRKAAKRKRLRRNPYSLHLDQPERKQLMPEITEPPTIESSVLQLLDIISELITRVEALEAK